MSGARTAGKTVCYSFAIETGDVILVGRIPSTDAGEWVQKNISKTLINS
jgi:hypothetical protein